MKRNILTAATLLLVLFTSLNSEGSLPKDRKQVIDTSYVAPSGCTIQRFRIFSPSMERDIKVVVVLPPTYQTDSKKEFPILYTLHGASAPYDTYAAMSLLQNELKEKPFIYTCFDGDSFSMYIDSKYPVRTGREKADTTKHKSLFTTFFFKEFIPTIDKMYRVDKTKKGTNRILDGWIWSTSLCPCTS